MRSDRPDTIIGGRIDITSITLVSLLFGRVIEISELVDAFNLFENMFTNTLTGNISIGDTNNLISNFPIVGQEEIHISIGTPNIERVQTKVFRVYRVSDITSSSLGERRYSIHILSDEFFTNLLFIFFSLLLSYVIQRIFYWPIKVLYFIDKCLIFILR